VERLRKSNGCGRWMAILLKLLTMAPETRSAGRRVTRSSTAGALAKKKGVVESVAVAKMPPKRKRKKPVKAAKKGRVAKRERVASVDEREDEDGEWECAECGALRDGMVGSAIFATMDLCASIRWAGACRRSVTLVVRKTNGGSKTVVK
jgi:hypothetical protein